VLPARDEWQLLSVAESDLANGSAAALATVLSMELMEELASPSVCALLPPCALATVLSLENRLIMASVPVVDREEASSLRSIPNMRLVFQWASTI
jgi:hypothetical protein